MIDYQIISKIKNILYFLIIIINIKNNLIIIFIKFIIN
jgi:hypothetical protein